MGWEGVWLGMYVCEGMVFGMVLFGNEVSSRGTYSSSFFCLCIRGDV